ncbi:hypothetical protein, partial [Vibrio parahaemolyticus]|uniref:hypothetical protein n=1 Tax=Vibrio parahaemolyticus TaxID=670 RepID=UPI0023611BCC
MAVLSQVNHIFVVKHNKQFNSDSQRLAVSLRVEFCVYGAVFKFSVCAAHTLIGRYILLEFIMLNRIEEWIDLTNERFSSQRKSCALFAR